jgi:hypothetical protein
MEFNYYNSIQQKLNSQVRYKTQKAISLCGLTCLAKLRRSDYGLM